jgi:hypothetical protein
MTLALFFYATRAEERALKCSTDEPGNTAFFSKIHWHDIFTWPWRVGVPFPAGNVASKKSVFFDLVVGTFIPRGITFPKHLGGLIPGSLLFR